VTLSIGRKRTDLHVAISFVARATGAHHDSAAAVLNHPHAASAGRLQSRVARHRAPGYPDCPSLHEVAEMARRNRPFTSIDIHNNTGYNPHY
jgi:hypothetical protein